jgi:hypothetical protein
MGAPLAQTPPITVNGTEPFWTTVKVPVVPKVAEIDNGSGVMRVPAAMRSPPVLLIRRTMSPGVTPTELGVAVTVPEEHVTVTSIGAADAGAEMMTEEKIAVANVNIAS